MNQNPYEAPRPQAMPYAVALPAPANRAPFILAAIGAWMASAYWAALTLMIGLGVAFGSVSGTQFFLPAILIGLYAVRGYQLFQGNPAAARRILWLHGIGGAAAIFYMTTATPLVAILQAIKVVIHIFGGVTAYLALRESARAMDVRA